MNHLSPVYSIGICFTCYLVWKISIKQKNVVFTTFLYSCFYKLPKLCILFFLSNDFYSEIVFLLYLRFSYFIDAVSLLSYYVYVMYIRRYRYISCGAFVGESISKRGISALFYDVSLLLPIVDVKQIWWWRETNSAKRCPIKHWCWTNLWTDWHIHFTTLIIKLWNTDLRLRTRCMNKISVCLFVFLIGHCHEHTRFFLHASQWKRRE